MPQLLRSSAALARGTMAAALVAGLSVSAPAQPPVRVTALGDSLVVRKCAEPACDVVAELPRGQAAQVLATTNGWHRVLITLEGARATTGWVEAARSAPAPAAGAPAARVGQPVSLPDRGGAASTDASPSNCLTCVATRTPTADEWNAAMKALPPPSPVPAPPAAASAAPLPRADVVRRDGRTSAERMRDEIDQRFGDELKRLGATVAEVDKDLQTYYGACYEKYLPIQVLPPGPTPPAGNPPPVRPRPTIFEMWRGRPAWAWTDTWSTMAATAPADSAAFCQGLWRDVSGRAADVRAALDRIEAEARAADIFPGVVRDAFMRYGLSDGR